MCGIAGYVGAKNLNEETLRNICKKINHRGPDDSDIWIEKDKNIGFAHTRLAIQDLSKNGSQPMISSDLKFIIIFNGEIYNHKSIRSQIDTQKKTKWRGNSDTETFLESLSFWGINKTLNNSSGMFAFALWDFEKQIITLGRDRFGEKPLYYSLIRNELLFGSEIKALKIMNSNLTDINLNALKSFISLSYVPAPFSIFKSINKINAGTYIQKRFNDTTIKEYRYYTHENLFLDKKNKDIDDYNAIQNLESLFFDSIKNQRISDAPIGCFLSGGIDSSLVASIMQAQSINKIDTFTVGFEDNRYDESSYARNISDHLHTNHHEIIVNDKSARDIITLLPEIYDEPFADSSQIPTYLISKFASSHVKVCLSGDGGDELFGGYNRYAWSDRILIFPLILRKIISTLFLNISTSKLENIYNYISKFLSDKYKFDLPGDKIHKLLEIIESQNSEKLYKNLLSTHNTKENFIVGDYDYTSTSLSWNEITKEISNFEKMMLFDLMNYLPDDILCKVDRASMANSLETRAPMLDKNLAQYAISLPLNMKIRRGNSKWILKQILKKYIPNSYFERPKKGFSIPIGDWLRGPLKDWANYHLDSKKISNQGLLNSNLIKKKWEEHLSGKRNWQYLLWNIISFQSWLDKN